MTFVGPMITAGLERRWFSLLGDVRYVIGSSGSTAFTGTNFPTGATAAASLSLLTLGVRPGLRLPLFFGAISVGVALDEGRYFFSPESLGPSQSHNFLDVGLWSAIDVKPVCDWAIQGAIGVDGTSYTGPDTSTGAATVTWVHVVYEPNVVCQRARDGAFKIEGTGQ
jgi:hypothetical protein